MNFTKSVFKKAKLSLGEMAKGHIRKIAVIKFVFLLFKANLRIHFEVQNKVSGLLKSFHKK